MPLLPSPHKDMAGAFHVTIDGKRYRRSSWYTVNGDGPVFIYAVWRIVGSRRPKSGDYCAIPRSAVAIRAKIDAAIASQLEKEKSA